MATATFSPVFTITRPTQGEANAAGLLAARDFCKNHLSKLPPTNGTPVTLADVDAANAATLNAWMTKVVRTFIVESIRAQRVVAADLASVQPVRNAVPDYDEIV